MVLCARLEFLSLSSIQTSSMSDTVQQLLRSYFPDASFPVFPRVHHFCDFYKHIIIRENNAQ